MPYPSVVEDHGSAPPDAGSELGVDAGASYPVLRYGQVWRYVSYWANDSYSTGWMLERAADGSFVNLVCVDGFSGNDAGYDGGYDAGYDAGYDGGY